MGNEIRVGMQGQVVAALQNKLQELGFHLEVDGAFGPITEAAVKQYQDEQGLVVDGIVGQKTIAALFPKPSAAVYKPPVRHVVLEQSLVETLERANGCVGAPIKYQLKYPNGGTDPKSNMPCDEVAGTLDCSGFTAWCLGYDRDFADGLSATLDQWSGNASTDSMVAEAESEGLVYTILDEPEVGCLIVSPSFRRLGVLNRVTGHTGIVVSLGKGKGLSNIGVVHCSPSNVKKNDAGSAVWKTNATIWAGYKKVLFLRFNRAYVLAKLEALALNNG